MHGMEPAYDPRVIKRGELAIKRLTDPKGSRDVHDWWDCAEAWKMAQDDCIYRAGSNGPYGETFRHYVNDWLTKHKLFYDLPASIRSNLADMQTNRLEIQAWHTLLPLKRRMKINSPSSMITNWKRDKQPAPAASPDQEQHKAKVRDAALTAMSDKLDIQTAEVARLRVAAGKRCDVDLLHSSLADIETWLRARVLDEHRGRAIRDLFNKLWPNSI
jgi:hypothetical protein